MCTKALAIKDDEDDLDIPALDGHDDDLPPAAVPSLNPSHPPYPHMSECWSVTSICPIGVVI